MPNANVLELEKIRTERARQKLLEQEMERRERELIDADAVNRYMAEVEPEAARALGDLAGTHRAEAGGTVRLRRRRRSRSSTGSSASRSTSYRGGVVAW